MSSAFAEASRILPEPAEEPEPEAEDAPAVELALRILQEIAESRLVCASVRVAARRFLRRLEHAVAMQAGNALIERESELG